MALQPFETIEEAVMRVGGSLIRHGNQPIWVRDINNNVEGGLNLIVQDIPRARGAKTRNILMSDPDLSITNLGLGYVNTKYGEACYTRRIPTRARFKQGIHDHNLECLQSEFTRRRYSFANFLDDPGFGECLISRHPSVKEAESAVVAAAKVAVDPNEIDEETGRPRGQMTITERAFHRSFAISIDKMRRDLLLLYKGEVAGWGDPGQYRLADNFKYLRESLEELGVKAK